MSYPSPRELLARHGLRPKKSWGQNFLVDERVYSALVEAVGVGAGDTVVEIGAGLGTLTARLAATGARVVAIERDRDMARVLRAELPAVELREENALELKLEPIAARAGGPVAVIGNLPYQIGSLIVLRALAQHASLARLVVMLQREVAERMVAGADTEAYGALSVLCQIFANANILRLVPASAFHPAPRVDSAIVLLTPDVPGVDVLPDHERFRRVVNAAFGKRRKTLKNALAGVVETAAFARAGIDPVRRGETLTVAEFARLARA